MDNTKGMNTLRSKRGRINIEILGGVAVAQQLSRQDVNDIRRAHCTVNEKTGREEFDEMAIGIDMFRQIFVGLIGFSDEDGKELEFSQDVVEAIIQFEPVFFAEFMKKAAQAFALREDVLAKN